jgi:hypothetical protein
MVQRFEFPLVELLLRSPRRHTYRSTRFCWTHCENPRFGVGRPSPVWPVAVTGLTGDTCPAPNVVFFMFFNTYLFYVVSCSSRPYLRFIAAQIECGSNWLCSGWHRSDRCGPEQTQLIWTFKNHFYINSIFFLESYTLLSSFCDSGK